MAARAGSREGGHPLGRTVERLDAGVHGAHDDVVGQCHRAAVSGGSRCGDSVTVSPPS